MKPNLPIFFFFSLSKLSLPQDVIVTVFKLFSSPLFRGLILF